MEKIQKMISEAWALFDDEKYEDARKLYHNCYETMSKDNLETESSILMGLIYVEAFSKNYELARNYAKKLISITLNEDDRHIYLHQLGMVERMAENYETALAIFADEESIIKTAFPNGYDKLSANMYEQGYINYKIGKFSVAKELMETAVILAEQSDDPICKACAYRGMGETLSSLDFGDKAKTYYAKAIEEFRQAGDMKGAQEVEEIMK
ncbi:hypothetical protein [Butyrivibrio sp. YAB3001]|uniref:hypothetical protein n=1 Tax=Butyrivibrio sp. YAB3001 TaxID=1520812 RepID=UPI0008F6350B|nr:hypothetical protein [Butyrivibrio sp. YAB3001]SFD10713.1 hypothetical protein SAMN02910398_04076 [Butyrivibrio sp. YAB3001]